MEHGSKVDGVEQTRATIIPAARIAGISIAIYHSCVRPMDRFASVIVIIGVCSRPLAVNTELSQTPKRDLHDLRLM